MAACSSLFARILGFVSCIKDGPHVFSLMITRDNISNPHRHFLKRNSAKGNEYLRRIITRNRTWSYHFTTEKKRTSMEWVHTSSLPTKEDRGSSFNRKRYGNSVF
ncbi:hypothetical protein TNCT_445661 [Trichonephila clavata]|uniref:Uncharacterized protein n=1 Tax=Trichonephila clavata TaxID=2740835 RepID=A0A8X6H221_TRICU|nr:hypothetical protein TNCT_445661 [Trichonephila clavata]